MPACGGLPAGSAGRVNRAAAWVLLVVLAVSAGGCGQDQKDRLRERAQALEQRVRAERDRIRERVQEILGQIKRSLPQAQRTSPKVQSRGRTGQTTIDAFLTDVLQSIDTYWTKTLKANGLPEPRIGYDWVPPGATHQSACGPAGANAAFYCPTDDTIYVSQEFAAELWRGVAQGLPGERAGYGHAAGDFGVAYVVAHEYGHNLQQELGIFTRATTTAEPFELQADCLAGSWGNSVYRAGRLQPGDVQEAINTALAVGDFDVGNAQHHGTPEQRREAWLAGFDQGDPSACDRYVPAA
jgi:predicted metalloprotease